MSIHDKTISQFELCILYIIIGINIFMTNPAAFFPCMNAEYFMGTVALFVPAREK